VIAVITINSLSFFVQLAPLLEAGYRSCSAAPSSGGTWEGYTVAKRSEISKQQDKAAKARWKALTPEEKKAEKKLRDEFVRTGRVPEVKEAKKGT
jgi:hypothetical protein